MSVRLHILLPVHNRRGVTLRFVEALARQTWKPFRLVLIDDGSTDGTADAVCAVLPDTVVVKGAGDWWWAGSLDQGCRLLERSGVRDDDVVLMINDDLTLANDFLSHAMAEMHTVADTLLLARQVDVATGREIGFGGGVYADTNRLRFAETGQPERVNCLPTRGLFLRWRDYKAAGGFRPERLPHYLSDYEFTHRAWRKGLKLKVAAHASVGVQLDQSGESVATVLRLPRGERFRMIFSRRFKDNPVTWSAFARLTASPWRRPFLWGKIWVHFLILAVRCLIVSPER